ncbi:hypothetical protein HMPREF1557_00144 [Streptococcus sobrinus W1703]|uniref:Uncharacterized protein n=1 Tax=Streptococcus sobrinus W1703 TaxID=1227275 RepID=U2KP21_9STRE|nr:hypothetical protein HMPREF1557_00144 [Streptococcus sobrinus W1703]
MKLRVSAIYHPSRISIGDVKKANKRIGASPSKKKGASIN